jgi:hypothetical protein
MKNPADPGDILIVIFIGVVFVFGIYMVFKFMRGGKK